MCQCHRLKAVALPATSGGDEGDRPNAGSAAASGVGQPSRFFRVHAAAPGVGRRELRLRVDARRAVSRTIHGGGCLYFIRLSE